MSPGSNVKRPHMVTKSYLALWADARKSVDVFDLHNARKFTTSIHNATVKARVYETVILDDDLEAKYARIEDKGLPLLAKLRHGHELASSERSLVLAFLEAFQRRGQYSALVPPGDNAIAVMQDGSSRAIELSLGDRLLLDSYMSRPTSLKEASFENLSWRVVGASSLLTGDGAVLFWGQDHSSRQVGVTFPLSPSQLLVIGSWRSESAAASLNDLVLRNSKRWIIGQVGTLLLTPDPHGH